MRSLLWNRSETIDLLEQELGKGGVVLAEGDTVLGLLANVSGNGARRLDHIKNRDKKPYLILVSDYKKALNLIDVPQDKLFQTEKLMNKCWPGPVTLIFSANRESDVYKKYSNGTFGIRVPHHNGLLQLLERFDALFSTSANSSGMPTPTTLQEVDATIMGAVEFVVLNNDTGDDAFKSTLPSTIIDCTGDQLVVVRHGAFPVDALTDCLKI